MTHSVSTDRLDIELFKGNGVCVCVCVCKCVCKCFLCARSCVHVRKDSIKGGAKKEDRGGKKGKTREYSKGEHSRDYKA